MFNLPFVPRATALAAATFVWSLSASVPAIAGPTVTSSPPYPAPGCTGGSLTTYQGTGSQGCTVGPVTFFDFTSAFEYVADSPTGVDPAPLIITGPDAGSGLQFSSALFDRTGQSAADYYFEYYIDPPIDIIGFRLRDAPFLNSYVEASVCVGATFDNSLTGAEGVPSFGGGEGAPTFTGGEGASTPRDSCNFPQTGEFPIPAPYYYFNINDSNPVDSQMFTAGSEFADVLLHVHIGADGHIDEFSTDPTVATALPEPATWSLTALGGLALAGMWRRKRRRAPRGAS